LWIGLVNEELGEAVDSALGERAHTLWRERLETLIPLVIERLRNAPRIYTIDDDVGLVVLGCRKSGIDLSQYISIDGLNRLRHDAHKRSAIDTRNDPIPAFAGVARRMTATAILAGVSPEEVGVSSEETDFCKTVLGFLYQAEVDRIARVNKILLG
jgi:hypothetical protein